MKLTSKSISSPARTDKFPPPLMRFLRSNAASRSRRSRSSPMFVLRKKNNTTNIETQEPSSPKVTCMGQVRAKRSSKSKSKQKQKQKQKQSSITPTHYRWWIKKPNTCRCRPVWPKWTFFRRKPTKQPKQDSLKSDSKSNFHQQNERRFSVSVDIDNAFASHSNSNSNSNSNSFSPPKNAFLLTRCRSAPYRSSSLASRFWSSPLRNEETESTSVDDNEKQSSHSKQRESISDKDESVSERIGSIRDSENVKELLLLKEREMQKEEDSTVARAVVLTRCKSEPARTGYGVEAEVNSLWKKTRLDFAVTSSPLRILPD